MQNDTRIVELKKKANNLFLPIYGNKTTARIEYMDGHTEKARVFKSGDDVCKYIKRSSRYGRPLPLSQIKDIQPIKSRKTIEQKWRDAWNKVKSRMEKSGLWEEIAKDIDIALEIGYEELQKAYEYYWSEEFRASDASKDVENFKKKYPSLVYENDEGDLRINTAVLYYIRDIPQIKKMRFCKGQANDEKLKAIKDAMDEGKKHYESGRYNYDIDFEYNPDLQKAWYSEEYKGCGNGYYYIAVDATHAVFWEKD